VRLVALGLAGAALLGGARPAVAQPVATTPLAANEVLLELDATGTDRRPADLARFQVLLMARGVWGAAASAEIEAQAARITAAVRAAGVAAGDVRQVRGNRMGFVGNEMTGDYELPAGTAEQLNHLVNMSSRSLEIVVRDLAAAERVRGALRQVGAGQVIGPLYELSDDAGARDAARPAALGRARADAEAYAAAMGMRVARIVRVGTRPATDSASAIMIAAMTRAQRAGLDEAAVETEVRLAVDVALAPR
jgi:uncharacterized protein YggE